VSRSLSKVVIAAARSWTSVSFLEQGDDLSGDETAQTIGSLAWNINPPI
jgi:hypothetical protein